MRAAVKVDMDGTGGAAGRREGCIRHIHIRRVLQHDRRCQVFCWKVLALIVGIERGLGVWDARLERTVVEPLQGVPCCIVVALADLFFSRPIQPPGKGNGGQGGGAFQAGSARSAGL